LRRPSQDQDYLQGLRLSQPRYPSWDLWWWNHRPSQPIHVI